MRRLIFPILAAALVAAAALAATVSPAAAAPNEISFGRTTAAADEGSGDRVFFVIGASSRSLFDEDDEDPYTDDDIQPTGEDDIDDVGEEDESPVQEALPSFPDSSEGRFRLLLQAGLAGNALSYEEALSDLELAFMFAGREQWVRNLSGGGVEGEPSLHNVTMESIVADESARNLLLGRAALSAERGLSAASELEYWQSLTPDWAPRVRDELAKKGVPFSVELLASPEINLFDPAKPLFGTKEAPLSLSGLGVFQKGENTFLRSLSAEDLMLEVWPAYYRYYHRPAGAPVPQDLLSGLTFGSPYLMPDGTFLRSPVMRSDGYKRWIAYGYPGVSTDVKKSGELFEKLVAGQLTGWFDGQYALFAPDAVSADVIERLRTLANGG